MYDTSWHAVKALYRQQLIMANGYYPILQKGNKKNFL